MKPLAYYFTSLLMILLLACQKKDNTPSPRNVSDNIISKLQAAGFHTSEGLQKYKDGYLVEYDIFLTEKQIDELAANPVNSKVKVEHYRSTNTVPGPLRTIYVYIDPAFDAYMQDALDKALERYNALNISIRMIRTPDTRAEINILAFHEVSNVLGYSAGFPSGGNPASPIKLNTYYYNGTSQRADAITTIAHEIGHAIGFRHTDYMNRAFSCGTGGNEGTAGVGAEYIPGTPSAPSANSWMLACSNNTDRPFTAEDKVALTTVYPGPPAWVRLKNRWTNAYLYDDNGIVRYSSTAPDDRYKWNLEKINGYTRIRNVSSGKYINIEHGYSYVECILLPISYASAYWAFEYTDGYIRLRNQWKSGYLNLESQNGTAQNTDVPAYFVSSQWIVAQ
ncbi:M57 family metalloprotease [Chitinophaga sp.]|uniref:M57 family metalloprotease n=1 Tax=Chitinophaga sp. TaxID=1869181 RepID=UPI0031E3E7EC